METTIEHTNLHVVDRITCQYSCGHSLLKTFLNSGNEFTWYRASEQIIHKLKMFIRILCSPFGINRAHIKNNIGKLTAATSLFLQDFTMLHGCLECLFVSYLWRTLVYFNFEFSSHSVYNDLEMQLTHTTQDGLTRFFIRFYT